MNIYDILTRVRAEKPLVHHITNWVTIYDCANMTRAIGALPVMAHAREEAADMASIASALVLNIGTLTPELVDTMLLAGKAANAKGIPVVLDAVGVGATGLRDLSAARILDGVDAAVIKGNASEVARLAGYDVATRGVEASDIGDDHAAAAKTLAVKRGSTVVLTGPVDTVTDGKRLWRIANGSPLMGAVVGTGCMAASVIGAFAAVEPDSAHAAVAALVCYEIAAEKAAEKAAGPGTFKELFFDWVWRMDKVSVETMARYDETAA